MISSFETLLILSSFLLSIDCICDSGYFTNKNLCDTKVTPIKCSQYTSANIAKGKWHYFYMSLDGIEGNIELDFELDAPIMAFLRFQPADHYQLPTDTTFDYAFNADEGGQEIPSEMLTQGIKNIKKGRMLVGLYNHFYDNIDVKIRYFTTEGNCKRPMNSLVLGLIIGLSVAITLVCSVGMFATYKVRRLAQTEALRIQNEQIPTQAILQGQAQNQVHSSDHLTLEEVQKYFPKKPFETLENPFQQIACSVCLEEFVAEIECHQLYCQHIFHETCVEKWLEKHNVK